MVCNLNDVEFAGERVFLEAIDRYLDERHVVYHNLEIESQELDTCVLIPGIGAVVIEVKGWSDQTDLAVQPDRSVCWSMDGNQKRSHPGKQARGYRFRLKNHIENKLGRSILVFHMVCYPFISQEYYHEKKLQLVSAPEITFFKEDLENRTVFVEKLLNAADDAVRHIGPRNRNQFDNYALWEIRKLFEPDPPFEPDADIPAESASYYNLAHYSCVAFIAHDEPYQVHIDSLLIQYENGTQITVLLTCPAAWTYLQVALKALMDKAGLNLVGSNDVVYAEYDPEPWGNRFDAFNFRAVLFDQVQTTGMSTFIVYDGLVHANEQPHFERLARLGAFNFEQYQIEHADPEKHILVRAGAGTGKTYTMILRIIFLCIKENILPQEIQKRIHMITFTNEAADNMKNRLKKSLLNYCRLTGKTQFQMLLEQIEHMRIGTIHSYALEYIRSLGVLDGYGPRLQIASGGRARKEILAQELDRFISEKQIQDPDYLDRLSMPIYDLRNRLVSLIEKLESKSINTPYVTKEALGVAVGQANDRETIHELITNVLSSTEALYSKELNRQDRIYLGRLMSVLSEMLLKHGHRLTIQENKSRFLFVDEFQDTDDVQIDALRQISRQLGYRFFVVGDIKQCIYRFRGAQEQAFDKLETNRNEWLEFKITKNYRTDFQLLDLFHESFLAMSRQATPLLRYSEQSDRLTSTLEYNVNQHKDNYYRMIQIDQDSSRMDAVFAELAERVRQMKAFVEQHSNASEGERTIALIVRENWQAATLAEEARRRGFHDIQTDTGGDLYRIAPAIDMAALLQALQHSRPAELFHLLSTNFFDRPADKIKMRSKVSSDEQVRYLTGLIDEGLAACNSANGYTTWEQVLSDLRRRPILQIVNALYSQFQPWNRFGLDSEWKREFYHLNVDLLIEKTLQSCTLDSLSLDRFVDSIRMNIQTSRKENCRWPNLGKDAWKIIAVTVHKAKGLEYGSVILPYANYNAANSKPTAMNVMVNNHGHIGYQFGYKAARQSDMRIYRNCNYEIQQENTERTMEEARILYVAMTRAIRSFSWIHLQPTPGQTTPSQTWQSWINLR